MNDILNIRQNSIFQGFGGGDRRVQSRNTLYFVNLFSKVFYGSSNNFGPPTHCICTLFNNQQSMSTAIDRSLYPLKFNVIKDIVNRFTTQSHANNHAYMYQEAQRFGCTERAYTRIIHELIDEGLVKKGSDASTIIPVDIDALKALIASYQK